MDSYELTDRGKIAIAVVIAVVLIALSTILMVKALAARSQQPDDQGAAASGTSPPSIVETTPPETADSPPPTGGGLIPPDTTPVTSQDPSPGISHGASPGISPPTPGVTPGSPSPTPAQEQNHSSVDPVEGTLSFHFSPESQNSLDSETTAMLGAFLGSPRNTRDSYVIIEIPQLSDEDTERLVAAVVSAFASQGVSDQRLSFSRNPAGTTAGTPEVNIYYFSQQGK